MIKKVKHISRHLLAIYPQKFTANKIGELKKSYKNRDYLYDNIIPRYVINTDADRIDISENYLQFIYEGDEEYILFDVDECDRVLSEEISASGLFGFCTSFSVADEAIAYDVIKNRFSIPEKLGLYAPQYLVIEIAYYGGTPPDYDWDMDILVVGYMNSDLKFVELNKINNEN